MKVDINDLVDEIATEVYIQVGDSVDDTSVMNGMYMVIESAVEDILENWLDDGRIILGS
jgi:UDP-N-acetylglucosamine transferase subunit ALG13